MTDRIRSLLGSDERDPGCAAVAEDLETYVEIELTGGDPAAALPGIAIHLRYCDACRTEHDGLLDTVMKYGDASPSG
jgi:hypothetical protein